MNNKDIIKYAFIFAIIFCAAFFLGFYVPNYRDSKMLEFYKSSMAPVANLSGSKRFFYILYRNTRSDLMTVISGILFGVGPFVSIIINGYLDGLTFQYGSVKMGYKNAALAIFPHGIFEVLAMIIAASYGLRLGKIFYSWLIQKDTVDLRNNIKIALKIYIIICIPLLVFASFIETYVTPHLYARMP